MSYIREMPNIIIETQTVQMKVIPATKKQYEQILGKSLKLWQEIDIPIEFLAKQSNKEVMARCPLCLEVRPVPMCAIFKRGHTYHQKCKQRLSAYKYLIGQKIGRLLITDFAEPKAALSGGNRTAFKARCDCGNETIVYAQSVKSAIKKNTIISCGCFRLEHVQQQGLKNTGINNGMYKSSISDEERERRIKRRKIQKGKNWSRNIKARDKCCIICNASEKLIAHHLYDFVTNKSLRYNPQNGLTLCYTHHQEFHYRYLSNTIQPCAPQDFYAFLKLNHCWSTQEINSLITDKNLLS